MENKEELVKPPEYVFDFDTMPILDNLVSLHQEGNYLVGMTEGGTRFKQRIPSDKMLSKNDKGHWTIVPLRSNLG